MPRKLLVVLLLLAAPLHGYAQDTGNISPGSIYDTIYRPPGLQWQKLQTPHFNILFPKGEEQAARSTGRILEYEYGDVQQLIGGSLNRFPVVLNNYNDRSNGYVTPAHFRMEVELPPIRGKTMNPRSGSWLETVMPHELVHALHLSVTPEYSLLGPVSLFSPDLRRAIHGAAPLGLLEGIAVEHESDGVYPGTGRGHYPYFIRTFDAVYNTDQRWSMGQMVHISSETRPFDRHYIGGYEFTDWLHDEYGSHTTRKAVDFHARWPFLGYGAALKHATNHFPAGLYRQFTADHDSTEQGRLDSLKNIGITPSTSITLPYDGAEVHRPKWLSSNQLIFYGKFYSASSGFYTYNLSNQHMQQLIKTTSVEDYYYDLSPDSLWYARYRPSTRYDNTFIAEIYRADLSTGSSDRITTGGRVSSPFRAEDGLYGIQTDHTSLKLVQIDEKDDIKPLSNLSDMEIVTAAPNPTNSRQWAVLARRKGTQGLWLLHPDSLRQQLQQPPDIAFTDGSIFDPEWHPSGDTLLFTADFTGTMQLYEYSQPDTSLVQVTNMPFNAMEGAYSPDGDRLACVIQKGNERHPVIINRNRFLNRAVNDTLWQYDRSDALRSRLNRPDLTRALADTSRNWPVTDYSSGLGWLKPRTWLPWYDEHLGGNDELGIRLYSSDLLRKNSYTADFTYTDSRFWYDLTYRHTGFYPGFELSVYSDPLYGFFQQDNISGYQLFQERAFAVRTPIPMLLEQNVHFSSLTIVPELRLSQIRAFTLESDPEPLTSFTEKLTGNLFAVYRHRLEQNVRDIMPNRGWVLFSELETDLKVFEPDNQNEPVVPRRRAHALRAGFYHYSAPLGRWNQSLRLGAQVITQTKNRIFDPEGLVSEGFDNPEQVLFGSHNVLSLNARYTIPFWYPDNGGLTVPLYFNQVYLAGFANLLSDLNSTDMNGFVNSSRSILGLGLRTTFRISNLTLDVGVAVAVEPSRNQMEYFFGSF